MASRKIDWMKTMEDSFMKLPPLPKNAKHTLVIITPWFALIFGILGLMGGLAGFGILTMFSPFIALSSGLAGATGSLVSGAIGVISSIFLLLSFPGTKSHKMKGWKMLFWSEVLNTAAAIISFALTGVIIAAIGFYLLFQIKSYYKK
jgi:hypothetical protein